MGGAARLRFWLQENRVEPFRPAPVKAPISPELLEQLDIRLIRPNR
jgi:hypothetical protein